MNEQRQPIVAGDDEVTEPTEQTAAVKPPVKKRRTRKSRVQKELGRDNVHKFDPSVFEDEGPLPKIPPRDGYAQRWVRVAIGNQSDARNLSQRSRRGWTPRPADTVDSAYHHMVSENESLGGIIGTHDLVLMERPVEWQKEAERIERNKRHDLELAVKTNLYREHKNIGGAGTGFTAPKNDSTASVERGAPRIQDD